MSTILEVTSPAFRGLKNPYTGEDVRVKMLVPKRGEPLFFAPDDYSTTDRFPTRAEMVAAWDRTDGRSGLRAGKPFVCAYTGKPLRPRSNGAQAWFEGGFDPHRMRPRAEFLYYATMRDGKFPFPPPPAKAPVVNLKREAPPPEKPDTSDISADAQREAEKIVDKLPGAFTKKTVSMATPKKRK